MKLSAKIFISFLLVSVAGIGMLVTANAFYTNRSFESYIRFKLMKNLAVFSQTLADFYSANDGWSRLAGRTDLWIEIVEERWPNDQKITIKQNDEDFLGSEISTATELAYSALPTPPNAGSYPHLALFDRDKNWLVGEIQKADGTSLLAVRVDEEIVGWVCIAFGERITHPLDQVFMEKQSHALIAIGGVVLLISVTIAFFLTRHLLIPIKELSDATDALAERDFEIRLPNFANDELGHLAKRFNMMAGKLASYERKQNQWISDISHELRTPLSILTAEIEAIMDGIRNPDKKALLSLRDEIKHLCKIVNDLHYISLSESGTMQLQMEVVKPLPILSQVLYLFENRIKDKNMSVEFQLDAKAVDLKIVGDRKSLSQLFTNLLDNSLKHTDKPGSLTIHHAQVPGNLHIVFEDTEPGVPDHALDHLFDRLYRADPARSRKTGGSGLGLAICKTIVERHNGSIIAQHSTQGGVKIEIGFPIFNASPSRPGPIKIGREA